MESNKLNTFNNTEFGLPFSKVLNYKFQLEERLLLMANDRLNAINLSANSHQCTNRYCKD